MSWIKGLSLQNVVRQEWTWFTEEGITIAPAESVCGNTSQRARGWRGEITSEDVRGWVMLTIGRSWDFKKFFFNFSVFRGGGRGTGNLKQAPLSVQSPTQGLIPWPEPKSRVGHSTDWVPRRPEELGLCCTCTHPAGFAHPTFLHFPAYPSRVPWLVIMIIPLKTFSPFVLVTYCHITDFTQKNYWMKKGRIFFFLNLILMLFVDQGSRVAHLVSSVCKSCHETAVRVSANARFEGTYAPQRS